MKSQLGKANILKSILRNVLRILTQISANLVHILAIGCPLNPLPSPELAMTNVYEVAPFIGIRSVSHASAAEC